MCKSEDVCHIQLTHSWVECSFIHFWLDHENSRCLLISQWENERGGISEVSSVREWFFSTVAVRWVKLLGPELGLCYESKTSVYYSRNGSKLALFVGWDGCKWCSLWLACFSDQWGGLKEREEQLIILLGMEINAWSLSHTAQHLSGVTGLLVDGILHSFTQRIFIMNLAVAQYKYVK